MHIHSYQIHNVLDAYLKHLSEGVRDGEISRKAAPLNGEKGGLTVNGQRQSIIEKVSREIVQRIVQFGPQSRFEDALAQQLRTSSESRTADRPVRESEFTYTLIDENNQRSTNTLTIRNFSPLMEESHFMMPDDGVERQVSDTLRNDRPGNANEE